MNDDNNNYLHINTINRKFRERTKNSMHVYEDMLKRCFYRVKVSVDLGEKSCFYCLPEFILGKPNYNMTECLKYIYDNIIKYGYYVKFLPPNIFFISWISAYNSNYVPISNEYVVKTAYQKFLEDNKKTEEYEKQLNSTTSHSNHHQLQNQPNTNNMSLPYKPLPDPTTISIHSQPNKPMLSDSMPPNSNTSNINVNLEDAEPSIFNIVPRTSSHTHSNWRSSGENQKPEYKPLKFNKDIQNLFH